MPAGLNFDLIFINVTPVLHVLPTLPCTPNLDTGILLTETLPSVFDTDMDPEAPLCTTPALTDSNKSLHPDMEINPDLVEEESKGTALSKEGGDVTTIANGDSFDIFSDSLPPDLPAVSTSNQMEDSNDPSADLLSDLSLSPLSSPTSPNHHHKPPSSSPNNLDLFLGDLEPSAGLFDEPVVDSATKSKGAAAADVDVDLPFPELGCGTPVAKTFPKADKKSHEPFTPSGLEFLSFGEGILCFYLIENL